MVGLYIGAAQVINNDVLSPTRYMYVRMDLGQTIISFKSENLGTEHSNLSSVSAANPMTRTFLQEGSL